MLDDILYKEWEIVEIRIDHFEKIISGVPRHPGLYKITSNIPKKDLRKLTNRKGRGHVDFERRLATTDKLASGLEISYSNTGSRIIYTGHHAYLRDRCRNHFNGYDGSGCLNLFEIENFHHYKWTFEYFDLKRLKGYEDSIITRTALEQHFRSKVGWPILCDR